MGSSFATPIAHQTTDNYAAFSNSLAVGRPFRQPLQTAANPADFSPGLELFLSSAGDVPVIFSWLDGKLRWQRFTAAGTIAVKSGSPTITGSLTAWDTELEGHTLQVAGSSTAYMILRVDSATQLTVERAYA